ncbi:34121_t:CDS:2 [Gigaspora margarita]|uniref:34121_t:CDS:1 n=1 Tax=Gigaspora margarita TaxID=4874 RepID=A0ABN7V7X8_GIGMA|nr:34121_t:CDS:2 [Gigaspora margarita]
MIFLVVTCGEPEHITKNCLSEKTEKFEAQYKLVKWSDKEKEQDKNIKLVTVESSEEEEVYVTHLQPYTKDQKGVKGKQKQSESCKEEALQRRLKYKNKKKVC